MSADKDRAPRPEPYAGPAFHKHPPASSLPVPKSKGGSSSGSNVSIQLSVKAWKPPPDASAQTKQASSESDKSSSESHSPIKEDNEAQAERETELNQASESLDFQQNQQSNIDDTEQKPAEVSIRDGPQEMTDIQDRKSVIPANVHLPAQRRPRARLHVAESSVVSERSTNHLLQLDYGKLSERDRARQQISQQRLDESNEAVEETGADFVGEGVGEDMGEEVVEDDKEDDGEDEAEDDEDLASTAQVEAEIDRYEFNHREETYSSLQVAKLLKKHFERTEQTAGDDGSKAEEGEAEVFVASQTFEDEGYFSMEA